MNDLFLSVLNMSMTASYVIAAIALVRLFLKKAPKIVSYALWAAAGFRLAIPFSFESMFSLIPFKSDPAANIVTRYTGEPIGHIISSPDWAPPASVGTIGDAMISTPAEVPAYFWLHLAAEIWIIGIVALLIYSVVSIILLKRQLRGAALSEGNIYEAGNLKTPFVLGFFRPKIYIPSGLAPQERSHIILHEETHIKHFDHVVKLFAFLILCVHWFNPLVWIAFILMSADMEMSCDERVLKKMGGDIKKAYSTSLLSMAAGRRLINGSPLAFGEGNIKGRIKNILNFKKPAAWVIAVSVVLVAALSIGFAANKANDETVAKKIPEGIIAGTVSVSELVLASARDYVMKEYMTWGAATGAYTFHGGEKQMIGEPASYDNWRIEELYSVYSYEEIDGQPVDAYRKSSDSVWESLEVYRLNYRLHTTTPEKVILAGGMDLDGEGWLLPTYPNATYLIFALNDNNYQYLFTMMENDCAPGDAIFTNDLRIRLADRADDWQPQPIIENEDDYQKAIEEALQSVHEENIIADDMGTYEKTALTWMDSWFAVYKALPEDNMARITDSAVDRLKITQVSKPGLPNAFIFSVTFSVRPTYPIASNPYWMAGNTGNSPGRDETWGQMSREVELKIGDDGRYHFLSMGTGGAGNSDIYVAADAYEDSLYEVTEAYKKAVEAYGWFDLTTMPTAEYTDENIREYNGDRYVRVVHETIKTYEDLEKYLLLIFSEEIVTELLHPQHGYERYRDIDGVLYAIPADRGTDVGKGEETYEVIRESDSKIIFRVTVETLGEWDGTKQLVTGYETHDFVCEEIGGRWVFSSFEMVR